MSLLSYALLAFSLIIVAIILLVAIKRFPELIEPSAHRNKAEIITLLLIIFTGLFAIYGRFLFGGSAFAYHDVGSDTAEQYVPYYLSMLDSIRNGTLGFWNFDYGLGTSFMSYQSWTLDPFNVILVPLGLLFGNAALGWILVLVQSLKVIACGLLFNHLLTRYCSIPLSRILGSFIFAFCGYLMLWGQHYWLGSVIVMATLLTLLLEFLMDRWTAPRFLGIMVVVALTVMMSTYSGFMVLLYVTAYVLLRLAHVSRCKTLGEYLKRFCILALPVICGLFISLLTLIPYATLLLGESSRVSGDGSLISKAISYLGGFVPLDWIPAILSRTLGNGLISCGADIPTTTIPTTTAFSSVNVYEFIQLGFSGAAFILLGQFMHWAFSEASKRDKVLISITSVLVVLYCFNYFLPAFSNVFVDVKYRSAFAVAIPICLALSVGWEKRVMTGSVAKVPLYATSALTLAVLAWSLFNTVNARNACLAFIGATIILTVLLAIPNKKAMRRTVVALGCACILSTTLIDGFMVTNNRITSTVDDFPDAVEPNKASNTTAALDWIHATDGGLYRIEKLYTDWTRLDDSLVQGYMGVSSYNSTLDSDIEDFYENLWPGMIAGDTAYQEYLRDPDEPALLRMLGVKYILSHDELAFDWCNKVASFDDVFVYQVEGSDGIARVYGMVSTESAANSLPLASRQAMVNSQAIVPDDIASTFYRSEDTSSTMTECSMVGSDTVLVEMSTSSDAIGCLALPNTKGWVITVDGQEVETFRANYGFIGFHLTAGEHEIKAEFLPSNMHLGIALAIAGLVFGLASCAIFTARRKR